MKEIKDDGRVYDLKGHVAQTQNENVIKITGSAPSVLLGLHNSEYKIRYQGKLYLVQEVNINSNLDVMYDTIHLLGDFNLPVEYDLNNLPVSVQITYNDFDQARISLNGNMGFNFVRMLSDIDLLNGWVNTGRRRLVKATTLTYSGDVIVSVLLEFVQEDEKDEFK